MTTHRVNDGRVSRIIILAFILSASWLLPGFGDKALAAPSATTSRYMSTVDQAQLQQLGCDQGAAAEDGVIVLNFGQPWYNGSTYGTNLFDGNATFVSIAQIEAAVKKFADGYWNCSPNGPYIRLVIGTSNYHGSTTYGHGQAWAEMVNRIQAYIETPTSYASQIGAGAGNDIELNWNSPSATRNWVNGYTSAGSYPYYNYGACEGCPTATNPGWIPDNGWSLEDVWFVSWGAAPANPLPEIYANSGVNAEQWQYVSLYAYNNHGARINVKGSMTQYQACQDLGCSSAEDNTPSQGWTQLSNALNADSRTAQSVVWSTDITWQN